MYVYIILIEIIISYFDILEQACRAVKKKKTGAAEGWGSPTPPPPPPFANTMLASWVWKGHRKSGAPPFANTMLASWVSQGFLCFEASLPARAGGAAPPTACIMGPASLNGGEAGGAGWKCDLKLDKVGPKSAF